MLGCLRPSLGVENLLQGAHFWLFLHVTCTSNDIIVQQCNYGYVLMIPRAAPSFESV